MDTLQTLPRRATLAGLLLTGLCGLAAADVTIEEKARLEAAIFKANIETTENFTADKKRHDSQMHCEGMMSMFCGNAGSGEIVRLDKGMAYDLEPAKKRYREHPLPTEAERKELQRRMKETMEKMKQCYGQQAQPQQPAVDPSKCEMSPAKVDVKNYGADGQIIGHDVHHSAVTMTSSCTNKETHEVCDMQFGFDVWLTDDKVAGLEERDGFTKAYMQKIGFTAEGNAEMLRQMQQVLAPYAEQLKQLKSKSGDFKGQALRTAFHVATGGAQCASAKKAAADAGASGDLGAQTKDAVAQSAAEVAASKAADGSVGGTIASRTLSSVGGKLLSGLFNKKKKAESTEAAAPKSGETADPNMVTLVKFSTETTAVTPGSVPAQRFEIPADWKRIEPKAAKDEAFTCPKNAKGE